MVGVSNSHGTRGGKWIYNSVRKWKEDNFTYWSEKTIERALKKLVDQGLVIKGKFNQKRFDQTTWYSLDYDRLDELELADAFRQNVSREQTECPNLDFDKVTEPIPETTKNYKQRDREPGQEAQLSPSPSGCEEVKIDTERQESDTCPKNDDSIHTGYVFSHPTITRETTRISYESYREYMHLQKRLDLPRKQWTTKDFVALFYCANTNTADMYEFPCDRRDFRKMESFMERYGNEILFHLIRFFFLMHKDIRILANNEFPLSMSRFSTNWIHEIAFQRLKENQAEKARQEAAQLRRERNERLVRLADEHAKKVVEERNRKIREATAARLGK